MGALLCISSHDAPGSLSSEKPPSGGIPTSVRVFDFHEQGVFFMPYGLAGTELCTSANMHRFGLSGNREQVSQKLMCVIV